MSKRAQRFMGHTDRLFHESVFLVYARELTELEEDVERLWEALDDLAFLAINHPHLWVEKALDVYKELARNSFDIKNIKMGGGQRKNEWDDWGPNKE